MISGRRCVYCRDELLHGIGLCWECWRLAIIAAIASQIVSAILHHVRG